MSERIALVTNDDGVDAPGLRHLALAARSCGLRIVVAAPAAESSGSSAALTSVQQDRRIDMERRTIPGLEDVDVFALPAAPAFITLLACRGAFGTPPALVVSGINRGANTGSLILHSGTVGAALTAASEGCASLAMSLCTLTPQHWDTAQAVAARVIPMLDDIPPGVALNVNVPDVPESELQPLMAATLAAGGAVQTAIAEVGDDFLQLGTLREPRAVDPASDVALVAAGHPTLTALRPMCEVDLAAIGVRAGSLPARGEAGAGAAPAPAPLPGAPRAR